MTISAWGPTGCAGRCCAFSYSQESPWPGALEGDWQGRQSAEGSPPAGLVGGPVLLRGTEPMSTLMTTASVTLKPPRSGGVRVQGAGLSPGGLPSPTLTPILSQFWQPMGG